MFKQLPNGVLVNLDLVFAIRPSEDNLQLSFVDANGRVMVIAKFKDKEETQKFLNSILKKK